MLFWFVSSLTKVKDAKMKQLLNGMPELMSEHCGFFVHGGVESHWRTGQAGFGATFDPDPGLNS
jgi:hypothetical protein